MITFLPHPNFQISARCLDIRRLGNQRSEAKLLIDLLEGRRFSKRWKASPAYRMWIGYTPVLKLYYQAIVDEFVARGYNNHMKVYPRELINIDKWPWWYEIEELYISHQSNLIRKKPEFYKKLWPDIPDNLPYYWPC